MYTCINRAIKGNWHGEYKQGKFAKREQKNKGGVPMV